MLPLWQDLMIQYFMKFRTEFDIPADNLRIKYSDCIAMLGSCFVENISGKLVESGFRTDINSFGIIYNPSSVSNCIHQLIDRRIFSSEDLFQEKGIYHSFLHHSRFSSTNLETALFSINERIRFSSDFLQRANLLIVTFGTAFVYRLKSSGKIVSNCHKLPEHLFRYERLEISEIVSDWKNLLEKLNDFNPGLQILFTVSPIRHWKNGAHENQLSKSILLLAVDELVKSYKNCFYFPSYEILLDDLRDYRFYAEDMLHPSSQAINYIWGRFSEHYFDSDAKEKIKEWDAIQRELNHKPFNPDSEEYRRFLKNAEKRRDDFLKKTGREFE